MGRLERKIDQDLVDRILANGPIKKQPRTKSAKTPRAADTYRGHPERAKSHAWQTEIVRRRRSEPPVQLNRSRKWKRAVSYEDARAQSRLVAAE
jgi:hypothetical protein